MSSQLDKNSAALAALVEYAGTLPPASSGEEVTAESITEALGYTPADMASVVQHTAQTLTEAQKTQARENIGAEKAAAKYELIETINVTDGTVRTYTRSASPSGAPYVLSKIMVLLKGPSGLDADVPVSCSFYTNTNERLYEYTPTAIRKTNATHTHVFASIYPDGLAVIESIVGSTATECPAAGNHRIYKGVIAGATYLTKAGIIAGKDFPTGTTIEIWGVRA